MVEEGSIEKTNELIESIAKELKRLYGSYWNFEIDIGEGSDIKRNFTLLVKVYLK